MRKNSVNSVQLNNYTDINERQNNSISSSKTEKTYRKIRINTVQDYSWISNREIQEVWEAALQMCRRARARAKILFINELSWQETRNRICTQRLCKRGRTFSNELQRGATNYGRNQQDQPGNSQPQAKIIEQSNGYHSRQHNRYKGNWLSCCQYAYRLLKRKSDRGGQL